MKKPRIYKGERFGNLTALFKISASAKCYRTKWQCQCDCGKETTVDSGKLRFGSTTSCGCRKGLFPDNGTIGDQSRTHGMSKTRIYENWTGMISRCENKNNHSFDEYGGRGIKVCNRWKTFQTFLEDMGLPPRGMSIDRKDAMATTARKIVTGPPRGSNPGTGEILYSSHPGAKPRNYWNGPRNLGFHTECSIADITGKWPLEKMFTFLINVGHQPGPGASVLVPKGLGPLAFM